MAGTLHKQIRITPSHGEEVVNFAEIADFLPVVFRTIGGRKSVKFIANTYSPDGQSLGFLRCLTSSTYFCQGKRTYTELIALPDKIDTFPDKHLNEDLYIWLAIFFASGEPHQMYEPDDPLAKDLGKIRCAYHTALRAQTFYRDFVKRYRALANATLAQWETVTLPPIEKEIDQLIKALLGDPDSTIETGHPFFDYVVHGIPLPSALKAPQGYQASKPVALWGHIDKEKHITHAISRENPLRVSVMPSHDSTSHIH